MTPSRNLRAFVLVAASAIALAAAVASLGAAPAAARHSDGTTYKGARANIIASKSGRSFTLEACDRSKDGYAAVAILMLPSSGKSWRNAYEVWDTNGADPHECGGRKKLRLRGKGKVGLLACIKDRNGDRDPSKRLKCPERRGAKMINIKK